jgi:hypothetical protein
MVGRPHTPALRYASSSQHRRLQLYLDGRPAIGGNDFVTRSNLKPVEGYTTLLSSAQKRLASAQGLLRKHRGRDEMTWRR